MSTPPQAECLCPSADLVERGPGVRFGVRLWGQPASAFALRVDGQAVAYVNRCAHVAAEMDSPEGQFLTDDKRWIICSIHGAIYDPSNGYCIEGPCRGERLLAIDVVEQHGAVLWWPTPDIQPDPAALTD